MKALCAVGSLLALVAPTFAVAADDSQSESTPSEGGGGAGGGSAPSTGSDAPAPTSDSPAPPSDSPAPADGAPPADAPAEAPEEEEAPALKTNWTFAGSITFVTSYWFRGYLSLEGGLITQPAADLTLTLIEGGTGLSDLWLNAGFWNCLHHPMSAEAGNRPHFESDFYAGLGATFGGVVSLSGTYYAYLSPSGAFDAVHELDLVLDAAIPLGEVASLTPSVTAAFELQGQTDVGTKEGVYVEPKVAFDVTLPIEGWDPSLSAAVSVGLSPASYYEVEGVNQPFGFFGATGGASLPLSFVPEAGGSWSVDLGASLFVLGPAAQDVAGRPVGGALQAGVGVEF